MSGPWEQFQATEQGPWSQFAIAPQATEEPEKQSAFRQVADIPLGFGRGMVQGVRMIADAFGAGSETSQKIKGAEDYLAGLMSAQAQNDQREISRIMKEAEDKGVLDQVQAGFKAFAQAPVDLLTQAFGTAVPAIVGTLGAKVLGAGALVATGAGVLTGAGMGAGTVKGSIYEETKKALKEAGATEEVAEEKAQQAQAYGGKNLDQILLGTVLGGAAAAGPLEKGAAGMLARRILGKASGEEVAEEVAKGALRRRAEAGALEAVPEALQAGQEQVAQNIALQREGFDVPTMRGVAGAATLEGLAGFGLGAAAAGRPARPEPAPEEKPTPPALEYKPDPYLQFADGTVAKQSEVEAFLKTLPEDEQMAMRAKLIGLAPQDVEKEDVALRPVEQLTEEQRLEFEAQRAAAEPKEDVFGGLKQQVQVAPPTTLEDIARIRDEYETSVIDKLLAQDAEMQSAADAARQRLQDLSDIESRDAAIQDVDRRLRESRIFSATQDLIDRNIPFASTAITDINQKFERINEAPLSNEERARVENIMGMTRAFTDFVKLPALPARPIDPFAENQQMEALIRERTARGQIQPDTVRAAPAAPSPVVQEAPVSERVGEGEPARPPSGIEPSVAEDRERVLTPVSEEPVAPEPSFEERLQSLKDQQQALLTKSGKIPAPKSPNRIKYDVIEAEIQSLSVPPVETVEQAVEVKPAEQTVTGGKPRKRPTSIMGSPMLADIFFSLGGLDTSLLSEFSTRFATRQLDRKGRPVTRYRNPMIRGFGTLFNNRGTTDFTEIATVLEDRGYLEPGSVERDPTEAGERAKQLILKALNREEVLPVDERAEKLAAEREEADRQADLERREENRAIAYGELQLDEEYMGPEDLQEALDLENEFATEMEIYNLEPEDFTFLSDQEFEEGFANAERAAEEERGARKTEQDTSPETAAAVPAGEAPAFDLERPTAEGLKAQEERIKEAEKREAAAQRAAQESERKAREERELRLRAEQTLADFELGKSAEEQMSGMEDMFKEEKQRTATKEQLDFADGHAASVGGTVVYQDGDISLVRGHSILTGQPVYMVANGNYRSKVDIGSYTGNLVTPEKKAELLKIKEDLEKADEKAFKKKPFIRFDDGMAASGSVPVEIAGIVRGWKDLLNLKPNLYVTTIEDARANKDKFNGPHRAIASSSLSATEAGSVRKLPNGDYYIAFQKGTSKTKMLEILGHELGHMHEREVFNNADPETQKALRDEHSKWLKSQTGKTAKELIESLRAKTSAKTTRIEKGLMADRLTPYWKSFSEWYADQVSRWSVTNEKPVSVVEKFFSRLGQALRNFYNKIRNQGYLPNETFVQYLEKVNKQPGLIGTPTKNEPVQGELFMLKEAKAATDKFEKWKEGFIREGGEGLQTRTPVKAERLGERMNRDINKVFAPKHNTILDKLEGWKDRTWQRVAQGVADQFRTIKQYSEKGYMIATLSKSVDGAMEGVLDFGQIENDGGALDIKRGTKGLNQVLQPLGKEVDTFFVWMALNREASLPDKKRSNFIDPETGEDLLPKLVAKRAELAEGEMTDAVSKQKVNRKEAYEKAREGLMALNGSVLDVAAGKGKNLDDRLKAAIIDKEAYDKFIKDNFFVPFYREMQDRGVEQVRAAAGLTGQEFSKALKGSSLPFADLYTNLKLNWAHILSASMKNQAAVQAIGDALYNFEGVVEPNLKSQFVWKDKKVYKRKTEEVAGEKVDVEPTELAGDGSIRWDMTEKAKGTSMVMIDGNETFFKVNDPLLFESISAIGYLGKSSAFLNFANWTSQMLRFGVTVSPVFRLNNLLRDPIAAAAVAGGKLKISPTSVFTNTIEGVRMYDKNNDTYISALVGGGIFNMGSRFEGNQKDLINRLEKMGNKAESILDSDQKLSTALKTLWKKYEEYGNKAESAQRLSLYKQLKDKNVSHLEAAFYARDLMDYSKQGAWPAIRILMQVTPFLNARTQGLYKLGRDGIIPTYRVLYNSVTGKEYGTTEAEQARRISDREKAKAFSTVGTAVTAATLLLYFMYKDDEDFKKRDDWDRDNFWWFKVPGIDYPFRIPKPFEIGAMATIAERITEQVVDEGAEGVAFGKMLQRMVTNTFALDLPQVFKPIVALYANKDPFSKAPIEGPGMEALSRQERISPTTSPLAIGAARFTTIFPEFLELSPVQAQYALQAYLGWMGATIGTMSQYAAMPFNEGEYPDARWVDRLSLGLIKELPSRSSGYITSYYENAKTINQAMADMRHYAALGQTEKVLEIQEEKMDKLQLFKTYEKVGKIMGNIRKQIRIVQADKTMTGAEKKQAINQMTVLMSEYAKMAEDIRKSMKGG